MRIFRYEPQKVESVDRVPTAAFILYWSLRGFTFLVAALLGLNILAAYVWVLFYASEGYTLQFEDRILGLVGDVPPLHFDCNPKSMGPEVARSYISYSDDCFCHLIHRARGYCCLRPRAEHDAFYSPWVYSLAGWRGVVSDARASIRKGAAEQALGADSPVSSLYS